MNRIGLALSGGGFRATLYHLGVVRYLRDAELLPNVGHITSVSGGSIIAAHLVLNWERYNGSDQDYQEAATELLDFVRMDVRNRIVRRFPLAAALNNLRFFAGLGRSRRFTRPGLLEDHYERYLYGDKCLYELPISPQIHILATNINEGSICSFTRSGILAQRRLRGGEVRFELIPRAMATIPMAVTASSAFPGFFPPLQLTASDIGADDSLFPPHLFTDGGVYDNLGVRMFRHIQESWIAHDTALRPDDFVDLQLAAEILSHAARSADTSPLQVIGKFAQERTNHSGFDQTTLREEHIPSGLWDVIVHKDLYLDPAFDAFAPRDEQAADLLRIARRGRKLDMGDHLWLNRYLVNEAFSQANQGDLFTSVQVTFDAVIASDAGKQFTIARRTRSGGLVGTAIRSSDILMNRVWELEIENFKSAEGFVFAPMSMTVHLAEDPTALHPEIQHQVSSTRTDLDHFTELEISGLVRHGYGVMRKVCRSRPDLFGESAPAGPPWDPTQCSQVKAPGSSMEASSITTQARSLQGSSSRRVLSRLLSLRDWPTYVFIPMLLLLLLGVPYMAYQRYLIVRQSEMIVDAITFSNPDFQLVLELARQRPVPGEWFSVEPEDVPSLKAPNLDGFRLITDTRILDTRSWDSQSNDNRIISYRRMLIRRVPQQFDEGQTTPLQDISRLRLQQFSITDQIAARVSSQQMSPILRKTPHVTETGQSGFMFEAEFDLSSVPAGEDFDLGFELTSPGIQGRSDRETRLDFPIIAPTAVATMWVLLPPGHRYHDLTLTAYHIHSPQIVNSIEPTYRFDMADGSLFGWMLVAPREDFVYSCRWTPRD